MVKVSEDDNELRLRGNFGEIGNLNVHNVVKDDPVKKTLKVGDLVDFCAIRTVAIAIRKGS